MMYSITVLENLRYRPDVNIKRKAGFSKISGELENAFYVWRKAKANRKISIFKNIRISV